MAVADGVRPGRLNKAHKGHGHLPGAVRGKHSLSITRNQILGKKVYNPDAGLVGEVSDLGFPIGEGQPTLIVTGADGNVMELPWSSVGAAKDVVLMKDQVDPSKFRRTAQASAPAAASTAPQAEPAPGAKKFCTSCGKPLTWIPQYKRWYCYGEKKYM